MKDPALHNETSDSLGMSLEEKEPATDPVEVKGQNELSPGLKRRYFEIIHQFGLHRSAFDNSFLEIQLSLPGHGRSTATGKTVDEVCARAFEWLLERDNGNWKLPVVSAGSGSNASSLPETEKNSWWVYRAFEEVWILPLNVKISDEETAQHICTAHENRLEELRLEIAQLERQYVAANAAFSKTEKASEEKEPSTEAAHVRQIAISVQPTWCLSLPIQQQSVLLLAARGPDGIARAHPCKRIQRAYRGTVLVAARYGRCLEWGERADTFMSLDEIADDEKWETIVTDFFQHADDLPHHFYMHLIHGAEIIAYKHPDGRFRARWGAFYNTCVREFHLMPETVYEMDVRLGDWQRVHWERLLSSPATKSEGGSEFPQIHTLAEENAVRIEQAKSLGWTFKKEGDYVVFEHPCHGMMRYFPNGTPEDTRDRLDMGEIPQIRRPSSSDQAIQREEDSSGKRGVITSTQHDRTT